jgi:hypothetical protein
MGKKVAFATSNWTGRPNKPANVSQTEWDAEGSSCFSGFPFPVYFAKRWNNEIAELQRPSQSYMDPDTGQTYTHTDPPHYRRKLTGWLDFSGTEEIYPTYEIPVSANTPSGVQIGSRFRPIIAPGEGWVGPMSREAATRLFWTILKLKETMTSDTPSSDTRDSDDSGAKYVGHTKSKLINGSYQLVPIEEDDKIGGTWFDMRLGTEGEWQNPPEEQPIDLVFEGFNRTLYFSRDKSFYTLFNFDARPFLNIPNFAEAPLKSPVVCDLDNPVDFYVSLSASATVNLTIYGYISHLTKVRTFTNTYSPRELSPQSTVGCADYYTYVVGPYTVLEPSQIINTNSGGSYSVNNYFEFCGYPEFGRYLASSESATVTPSNNFFMKLPFGPNNAIIDIPLNGAFYYREYYYPRTNISDGEGLSYDDLKPLAEVGSFSLTIEPKEFLEYDDGKGNPIYDKNTGAILRDPITGEEV